MWGVCGGFLTTPGIRTRDLAREKTSQPANRTRTRKERALLTVLLPVSSLTLLFRVSPLRSVYYRRVYAKGPWLVGWLCLDGSV